MARHKREPEGDPDDIFEIAAQHYARDYESRISCLWPFLIIPVAFSLMIGGLGYLLYLAFAN